MKKFIALCLSALLLTSSALGAQWPTWCEEARVWGEEASLSETFTSSPDTVMTRSMTARLFYELAGSPEETGGEAFADVSGPDAGAISWAAKVGLVKGVGEGRFDPDSPVTRQDFALMLYRWLGEPRAAAGGLSACTDREKTGPWAWEALNWCLRAGVMEDRGEGILAPRDNVTTGEALLMARRAEELPDLKQMETDLETLTASPRPIGSQGEQAAAAYLKERFTELGYEVTLQPYTDEAGNTGTNVIAVRAAEGEYADILVLSAHHDSVPSAYGANDNASGVAALLYAAEALKDVAADTELRFISFTDEENGKKGSRHYTSTLTEDERERMVGDIQFDMLGGLGSRGTLVCTTDGRANWLSDALMEQDGSLSLGAETASDHSAFQLAGVPAVLLMQNGRGYLYHSAADRAEELDLYAIARAARTAEAVVREVASADTSSYRETAHAQAQSYTYRQTRQNVIYFDSSLAESEAYIGAAGELVDHREVTGTGWSDSYDTYLYSMLWFDGDTPMNTYYEYRNGYLQSIEIRPFETGYTTTQVRDLLLAMYGQPTRTGTDRQGNPFEAWQDEIYSKYLTLTETADGCTVTVSKFSLGVSNVLADYPVTGGQADIDDPADKAVWDLVCAILPEESRQKIARFTLFTDGASNILAFTSPLTGEDGKSDNTRFAISIDYYDVYDETGAPRDWSKLIYTILHEYGHVLLEDETQIDLSQVSSTHDPAGFIEGSFRKAFYDTFWKDLGDSAVGDYEENPTHYVSRCGANYFHEDIADTFALFVLGGRPTGETVAGEKLNFFWADSDMVALRSAIRQNLALELKTAASAPAEPESPDGPAAVSDLTELQEELERAMAAVEQPPVFDVSALAGAESLELDVINCYNRILSQHPEYKYAYALTPPAGGGEPDL